MRPIQLVQVASQSPRANFGLWDYDIDPAPLQNYELMGWDWRFVFFRHAHGVPIIISVIMMITNISQ